MLTERKRLSVVFVAKKLSKYSTVERKVFGDQTAKAMSEVVGQREEQNGRKANSQQDGDLCLY